MFVVITYIILAATIFVARSGGVAITKAPCALDTRGNIISVNCNRQRLTDDAFKETFASLTTTTQESKIAANKKNNNSRAMLMLEFHELDTLRVIPNVPQMARVIRLSFKQNQIVSAQTGVFQNLPALRYLDLSYNQLTGSSLVKEVFQSRNKNDALPIEFLNLGNNNISTLNFDVFFYLRNLKSLSLSKNPIRSISPEFEAAFRFLKDLQILEMTQAELSTLPDNFLSTNVISELYMSGNRFSRVPKCLGNIRSGLRILNLNGNSIQKLDATSFDMLSDLNELHLNGMETLTAIAANTFSPLINLRKLRCSYNSHLKTVDSAAFEGLKSKWGVQELHLNNNDLEFLANDTLPWNMPDVLDLSGNPWRCTCSLKWLMDFARKRQYSDPESNLGMHCEYPPELKQHSLVDANVILDCSSITDDSRRNSPFAISGLRYMWSTTALFGWIIIAVVSAVSYLVIRRRKRAKMLKVRYSGIVGRSIVKYKRTQLNDDENTHPNN